MQSAGLNSSSSTDPVMEILARIWQTKLRSVSLLEDWIPKTTDFEVKAGLQAHLTEERRHLRLLGDEIKRRGGRYATTTLDQVLSKPFALVMAQPDDLSRVRAFHYGIKASCALHCSRLIPLVDLGLGRVLEQISRDEERHIRWADVRLARSTGHLAGRHFDASMARLEAAMEAVWSKPWRRLSQSHWSGIGRTG
jgi:hypothetical protein